MAHAVEGGVIRVFPFLTGLARLLIAADQESIALKLGDRHGADAVLRSAWPFFRLQRGQLLVLFRHHTWHFDLHHELVLHAFSVADGEAMLVRPDGHLAWRGAPVPDALDERLTGILGA